MVNNQYVNSVFIICQSFFFFRISSSNMRLNLNELISGFLHRAADLTLVPSAAIGKDLIAAGATAGE